MTAPIYSASILQNGQRELGSVTNSFAGYLESDGGAYNITLPWYPDCFQWWNYTTYATNDTNLQGVWFRDMPAGDGLIINRGTTTLTSTLETTNGVTVNNTAAGFTDEHVTITGASAASPCVITAASHGLSNGDRVIITKIVGNMGDVVNNNRFVAQNVTSNTFELYDVFGDAVSTSGLTYTSGGQVNKEGPELDVQNSPAVYQLTLGTAVIGADSDALYFVAWKFNNYVNIGDIA